MRGAEREGDLHNSSFLSLLANMLFPRPALAAAFVAGARAARMEATASCRAVAGAAGTTPPPPPPPPPPPEKPTSTRGHASSSSSSPPANPFAGRPLAVWERINAMWSMGFAAEVVVVKGAGSAAVAAPAGGGSAPSGPPGPAARAAAALAAGALPPGAVRAAWAATRVTYPYLRTCLSEEEGGAMVFREEGPVREERKREGGAGGQVDWPGQGEGEGALGSLDPPLSVSLSLSPLSLSLSLLFLSLCSLLSLSSRART